MTMRSRVVFSYLLLAFFFISLCFSRNAHSEMSEKTGGKADAQLNGIASMITQGRPMNEVEVAWKAYLQKQPAGADTDAALLHVLRKSLSDADRRFESNLKKERLSDSQKKDLLDKAGEPPVLEDRPEWKGTSKGVPAERGPTTRSSPGAGMAGQKKGFASTIGQVNQYVGHINNLSNSIGSDPNYANTEVQNAFQQHQQTLQIISSAVNLMSQIANALEGKPKPHDPYQQPAGSNVPADQGGMPPGYGSPGYPGQPSPPPGYGTPAYQGQPSAPPPGYGGQGYPPPPTREKKNIPEEWKQ
jgi:hypothetical protein